MAGIWSIPDCAVTNFRNIRAYPYVCLFFKLCRSCFAVWSLSVSLYIYIYIYIYPQHVFPGLYHVQARTLRCRCHWRTPYSGE